MFCCFSQYFHMQTGNQHGGRDYDYLQNLLDMTSHENPLLWQHCSMFTMKLLLSIYHETASGVCRAKWQSLKRQAFSLYESVFSCLVGYRLSKGSLNL